MFQKGQNIEEEFMHYNSDDTMQTHSGKGISLGTIIQILLILLLLVILAGAVMFGYNYLQKGNIQVTAQQPLPVSASQPVAPSVAPAPQSADPVATASQKQQKLYTQEEMQMMMQMMMEQMLKKRASEPKQKKAEKESANLVSALEEVQPDQIEEVGENLDADIENVQSTKAIKAKKDDGIDRYNKIVVSQPKSDDALSTLSKGLSALIEESEKEEKGDAYTSSISKEVDVRKGEMRVIVVQKGDTLSKIAKRAYGSAMAFDRILKANPELIKNPNLIRIGQRLRVPLVEEK
ncbi:MAG: hypothetical protein B6D59_01870 [Campylobacteraceae bacterium 4484_4]|nr:MAG: hypothetical protein B6D59_01870 [Campylobacteraceae bacterium 4484_4]